MEPIGVLGSHMGVNERPVAAEGRTAMVIDTGRFEEFYRRQYGRSVRLAWLLTGSRPAAEDVVQDAMTAVYRSLDRIDHLEAYLRRAVVNRAKSRRRDEKSDRERAARLSEEPRTLAPADAELLDLVRQLPYRQRVVIVARYWGGWSEAEIASALDCRPGTVKSLASRALDRLRTEVNQ
jgi:RNA polymerase sigma factor (sigma-70 family)